MQIEFAHDVGAVGFDGLDANAELGCDFLARTPFGEQLDDLAFPGAQACLLVFRFSGLGGRIQKAVEKNF